MTTFQLSIVPAAVPGSSSHASAAVPVPAMLVQQQQAEQSCAAGSLAEIGDTHENSDVVRQIDKPTTKKNKKSFEHLYLVLGLQNNA